MNYTENLSLGLPEYGEDADVADLNRNSGILDAYCYNTRQIECEPYDSTKTYMSGDLAIHNEAIYECNTDNTTGTWDDSKWDSTTLAEQIAKAKQSGGESALADLEDVNLTNPSEGQILTYDDTNGEWVNTDNMAVTKEATGNPIELTDAASAPLVKCVTEIQGSQDLHGYDKPWVGGAGKNKLPLVLADIKANNISGTWSGNVYTYLGCKYTLNTDDGGNVISIGVEYSSQSTDVALPFSLKAGSYVLTSGFSEDNGINDSYLQKNGVTIARGNGASPGNQFTLSEDSTVAWHLRVTNKNYTAYPMIRLSTESDSTFTPYSNICPITAYTEGEIEVGDGDGNTTTHTTTYPSAIYRGSEDVVDGEVVTEWGVIASYSGETLPGEWISDRDEYAPGTTPTTGAQVAYELATPTTSSVTPTNLPIKSLSGYNHIESSTGEMEIEYITGEYQPLVDLIQSGNGHTYSTQEQVVGKWIDGRPIYERTFVVPNFSATSVASGTFYEGVLDLSTEFADVERSWGCIDSSYIELQDTTTRIVNFVDTQNPKQPTVQFLGAARTGTLTLTMQYLKSTNATRSLSAPVTSQKAQIEPLTDKTEEVPTEEEKAVNEEENNDETR